MFRPSLSAALVLLAAATAGAAAKDKSDLDARAEAFFATVFAKPCDWAFREDGSVREPPERHDFDYTPPYGETYTVTIFRFECNVGAYNTQQVYLVNRSYEGLSPIAFAAPTFETAFENDDDENGALLELTVTGMTTRHILINSEIDPDTGDIAALSYWRGLGDASSYGEWERDGETYALKLYEIDPSYDGEMNPVTALDYRAP